MKTYGFFRKILTLIGGSLLAMYLGGCAGAQKPNMDPTQPPADPNAQKEQKKEPPQLLPKKLIRDGRSHMVPALNEAEDGVVRDEKTGEMQYDGAYYVKRKGLRSIEMFVFFDKAIKGIEDKTYKVLAYGSSFQEVWALGRMLRQGNQVQMAYNNEVEAALEEARQQVLAQEKAKKDAEKAKKGKGKGKKAPVPAAEITKDKNHHVAADAPHDKAKPAVKIAPEKKSKTLARLAEDKGFFTPEELEMIGNGQDITKGLQKSSGELAKDKKVEPKKDGPGDKPVKPQAQPKITYDGPSLQQLFGAGFGG